MASRGLLSSSAEYFKLIKRQNDRSSCAKCFCRCQQTLESRTGWWCVDFHSFLNISCTRRAVRALTGSVTSTRFARVIQIQIKLVDEASQMSLSQVKNYLKYIYEDYWDWMV